MKGLTTICLLSLTVPLNAAAQHAHDYGTRLGSVDLPVSCTDAAMPHLERGLALLHHMTYEGAAAAFAAAADADPSCAMGYWGQALSFVHPLWSDPPSEELFEKGRSLLQSAKDTDRMSDRDRAYVEAVEAYYAGGWSRNESQNLAAFQKAWERVHQQDPDDPEAATLYALSLIATADPTDKTFENRRKAGKIAEEVLARKPDHPGAFHYLIHTYDVPELASDALEAARGYSDVAPEVPHALHMPTHIFTRLGLWEDAIAWNKRSAAAAKGDPVDGAVSMHYLHALDYLVYAHLQRGEDREAEEVVKAIAALEGPIAVGLAPAYTLAAAPARLALERRNWSAAADLAIRAPSSYPWDSFPAIEAITRFARALGAARSGDTEAAAKEIEMLSTLRDRAAETSGYWANQIDIQRLIATAWMRYHQGATTEGLETIRKAAEMEASTDKHPVTPGEVLPAHELLGDMLMEMDRFEEARSAYELSLDRSPNRFNSLYAAGRAAELSGDAAAAGEYYTRLVEVAPEGDEKLEPLRHARAFLTAD